MDRQRIDKWLWHARMVRTRSAAAALADAGFVRLNGKRVTAPSQLVRVGDVVTLAAGDMIPADVRMLVAKDLFETQSSLTGESFPVEKFVVEKNAATAVPIELTSIGYLSTSDECFRLRRGVVLG